MIFSSIFFLFFFLPVVLLFYYSVNTRLKNLVLLAASLLFYAWGEMGYVLLMLFSISLNYFFGLWLERARRMGQSRRIILGLGVGLNLAPLVFFKYANFIVDNLSGLTVAMGLPALALAPIHLPIGISFFTFQAISYIIDVYRQETEVQKKFSNLALYIALFPQLIAGPIVRYHDVARQLAKRSVDIVDFHYGVQRFITGLGKKVLIANNVGAVADHIFGLPSETMPAGLLWLGIVSYTLQIYYDFSGYSDMAIGLGRMFGFRFLENFQHPYAAVSMQDFWRRWHISLSSWFKDYLYIPLGGNRKGSVRTYVNLLTVFFLCGLWHGASWNFVFWGVYHGFFLILERRGLAKILLRMPRFFQHCYAILVFTVGWVFFNSSSMPQAIQYLSGLVLNFNLPPYLDAQLFSAINVEFYGALGLGLLFSWPIVPFLSNIGTRIRERGKVPNLVYATLVNVGFLAWIAFVAIYSSAQLVSGTHNPFLYFRF